MKKIALALLVAVAVPALSLQTTQALQTTDLNYNEESEVEGIIKELLEGRVRPFVQEDGGDIKFISFNQDTGIVTLEMQGSCAGCPSSFATLKEGVEKMLVFYLPEVKGVISLN